MAAAAVNMLAFAFASCKEDENSAIDLMVELPPSVGENPFAGKTFIWGSEETKESDINNYGFWDMVTWVVNDSTVLEPETEVEPEYIGTAAGTYECSGTGTKDCTATITATELPEIITGLEKNKPYVLTMADYIW